MAPFAFLGIICLRKSLTGPRSDDIIIAMNTIIIKGRRFVCDKRGVSHAKCY